MLLDKFKLEMDCYTVVLSLQAIIKKDYCPVKSYLTKHKKELLI